MKYLTILVLAILLSCQTTADSTSDPQTREFEVDLKFEQIIFYGDSIFFEEPLSVKTKANTNKVTLINLGNGNPFGIKYFVSERVTGSESELVHNAVFYEEINGDWLPINPVEHREPCVLMEEKKWGIGSANSQGTFFKADFTYLIKEI